MTRKQPTLISLVAGIVLLSHGTGCERQEEKTAAGKPVTPVRDVLIFPDSLRVQDESVNEFLSDAMRACISGDYEVFRLLWSAQYDPVTRDQFESAWRAVEKITIAALERDAQNDSYAVFARVTFDPDQLPRKHELHNDPRRDVVLLIIREHDDWRLARAPKPVRKYFVEKFAPVEDAPALIRPMPVPVDQPGG